MGNICSIVLPIPEEKFFGNSKSNVAICTLSSVELLQKILKSNIMEKIAIVGRLLSENKGIDELLLYVNKNPNLSTIVICGKEVIGHKSGHALMCLYKYGIDENMRIINCLSPDPVLSVSKEKVERFRNQIKIINIIGETNIQNIIAAIQ